MHRGNTPSPVDSLHGSLEYCSFREPLIYSEVPWKYLAPDPHIAAAGESDWKGQI